MPYQKTPSAISSQKPVNIFYVWYTELCRRLNSTPAPVVKPAKPKCQTILNFVADRLKVEEWNPVISALRHDTSLHVIAIKSKIGNCQFLHEVDTEEKLRLMKRRSGCLWTAFILKSLLRSLSCTVRNTQVLTCLEFDGLPIYAQYLEPFMKALQKNKTLKTLTFSRCRIGDAGCQIVCTYVRFAPNIEILNLSGCALSADSAEYLSKLIKYQQINRYCESWHNSLRYSDPNIQVMRGLKRITLNGNPLIGDVGLDLILSELDDDLWIKALDMQNCGITEKMAKRIIDLVEYSQSLEIADFRLNEDLSVSTVEQILHILKERHVEGTSEYQWCNTSYTLTGDSVVETMTNYTAKTPSVYKTKSAPIKKLESRMSINERPVRKVKTSDTIPRKQKEEATSIQKKVMELSNLLQEEINRRKKTEQINEELKRQLSGINGVVPVCAKTKINQNLCSEENCSVAPIDMLNKICRKNGFKKKNGVTQNGFHDTNGYHFNDSNAACTIFEKLVGRNSGDNKTVDQMSLLDYVDEGIKEHGNKLACGMRDSQISLVKFMENLKNTNGLPVKNLNSYCITDKLVKKKKMQ